MRLDKGCDRPKRCLIKSLHLERSVRRLPFLLLQSVKEYQDKWITYLFIHTEGKKKVCQD